LCGGVLHTLWLELRDGVLHTLLLELPCGSDGPKLSASQKPALPYKASSRAAETVHPHAGYAGYVCSGDGITITLNERWLVLLARMAVRCSSQAGLREWPGAY
jgi:hypothetical protein